ncbi:SGNH/GDSL hydrolase family protein [Methylobacterium sp. WL9]|uniref:SGNH/GDSL hydrolase family protein n=1 Tax=Methylobacterium sp. WL9 TaxID=2603898 RepID=UPI001FEF0C77|nr:SGNH/GDSL hydrolase family protein [Methylobacterium sp. WL9]
MRRVFGLALAFLTVSVASAGIGWVLHAPKHDVGEYAVHRLVAIRQQLEEAEPGYVLIAGDSQAELQSPSERVCGAPIVNAGVSGATAAVYAGLLPELEFPVRAGTAILTIGTNDLIGKKKPLAPDVADRFEQEVAGIVARFKAVSDRVVVTAVPPLGRELADEFEAKAVDAYSERIKALCTRIGCRYADPFSELRDGETGFGLPGANRNGLHLTRYRPMLRNLAATLCPDAASAP